MSYSQDDGLVMGVIEDGERKEKEEGGRGF